MKNLIILVFLLSPVLLNAQQKGSNEFKTGIGTHFYPHSKQVESTLPDPYLKVNNSIANSIFVNYTRVTKNNLLLGIGVEAGYERFKGKINFPFLKYNFYPPDVLSDKHTMDVTTFYARLNLGIGYRLKLKNRHFDVAAGNMMQISITSEEQYHHSLEKLNWPYLGENYTFYKRAHWGKDYEMRFPMQNIAFLYLGTSFKQRLLHVKGGIIDIGIRLQRNFISPRTPLNLVGIEYYDNWGKIVGRDSYYDNQLAISLMLGVNL